MTAFWRQARLFITLGPTCRLVTSCASRCRKLAERHRGTNCPERANGQCSDVSIPSSARPLAFTARSVAFAGAIAAAWPAAERATGELPFTTCRFCGTPYAHGHPNRSLGQRREIIRKQAEIMQRITTTSSTPHPTPDEIRAMCLLIQHDQQATMLEAKRAGFRPRPRCENPVLPARPVSNQAFAPSASRNSTDPRQQVPKGSSRGCSWPGIRRVVTAAIRRGCIWPIGAAACVSGKSRRTRRIASEEPRGAATSARPI